MTAMISFAKPFLSASASTGQGGGLLGGQEGPLQAWLVYGLLAAAGGVCIFLAARLRATTKRMEEQQKQARTLFDHNGSGHLIVSSTRQILDVNHQFCDLFGYQREELIGQSAQILHLDRDHYEEWAPRFQEARGGRAMGNADYPWRRKDGTIFWCTFAGVKLLLPNGEPGVVWSVIDITERKRVEEALKLARFAMDKAADAIFWIRADSTIVDANEAACRSLGYAHDELVGLTVTDVDPRSPLEAWPAIWATRKEGKSLTLESVHRRRDGTEFPVEVSVNHIKFGEQELICSIVRDIRERRRTEEERFKFEQQLLRNQKLESLGVLAGGIAHDFNNILTSIIGNVDLALLHLNPESPVKDRLERIEQGAVRAADLARQMLAYSGKGQLVTDVLDVNRLVEEMLHMLEVSISKKVVLRLDLHQPLPWVEADATQLRQVLMNLVINASEAIGDKSGVIAISTGCMECDRQYLKDIWLDGNLDEGLYVYLEVADTGCGMEKETLHRIFDPFFTTKFMGRGLGMAAVLGIVRGHKGAIKVYSEPGKGTTFKILLPGGALSTEMANQEPQAEAWTGSGTILLVDDEETVRTVGSEMLKELGFQVLTAEDGGQALVVYREHPEIRLVLLDLIMPHMDGEQAFRELRQMDPQVPVILSSGFSEYEVHQKFAGNDRIDFIQKPYRLTALRETLQNIGLEASRDGVR
jgi:PAS domain S-box-containing protein